MDQACTSSQHAQAPILHSRSDENFSAELDADIAMMLRDLDTERRDELTSGVATRGVSRRDLKGGQVMEDEVEALADLSNGQSHRFDKKWVPQQRHSLKPLMLPKPTRGSQHSTEAVKQYDLKNQSFQTKPEYSKRTSKRSKRAGEKALSSAKSVPQIANTPIGVYTKRHGQVPAKDFNSNGKSRREKRASKACASPDDSTTHVRIDKVEAPRPMVTRSQTKKKKKKSNAKPGGEMCQGMAPSAHERATQLKAEDPRKSSMSVSIVGSSQYTGDGPVKRHQDTNQSLVEKEMEIVTGDKLRIKADHKQLDHRSFCKQWILSGACGLERQGCIYKHIMPDLETLREMGVSKYPSWWLILTRVEDVALSSERSVEERGSIFEKMSSNVGLLIDITEHCDHEEDMEPQQIKSNVGTSHEVVPDARNEATLLLNDMMVNELSSMQKWLNGVTSDEILSKWFQQQFKRMHKCLIDMHTTLVEKAVVQEEKPVVSKTPTMRTPAMTTQLVPSIVKENQTDWTSLDEYYANPYLRERTERRLVESETSASIFDTVVDTEDDNEGFTAWKTVKPRFSYGFPPKKSVIKSIAMLISNFVVRQGLIQEFLSKTETPTKLYGPVNGRAALPTQKGRPFTQRQTLDNHVAHFEWLMGGIKTSDEVKNKLLDEKMKHEILAQSSQHAVVEFSKAHHQWMAAAYDYIFSQLFPHDHMVASIEALVDLLGTLALYSGKGERGSKELLHLLESSIECCACVQMDYAKHESQFEPIVEESEGSSDLVDTSNDRANKICDPIMALALKHRIAVEVVVEGGDEATSVCFKMALADRKFLSGGTRASLAQFQDEYDELMGM